METTNHHSNGVHTITAIDLLCALNTHLDGKCPSVLRIAEAIESPTDSTSITYFFE